MKKSRIFKRLFSLILVFVLCLGIFSLRPDKEIMKVEAKSISELEKEIQDLKNKQQQYQSMISSLGSDIKNAQAKQTALQNQINTTQSLVNTLNTKITNLEAAIASEQDKITQQEKEIEEGVEVFKQRLRALYLAGDVSAVSVLLESSDFFDMLMKLELIERVAEHDKEIIDNLVTLKKEYEDTKLALETDKLSLESTKAEYDSNLTNLNSLYADSKEMIAQKQSQEAHYKSLSSQLQAEQDKIEKEIDRIIASQSGNNTVFSGTFLWPLPNYHYITSYYGPRWGSYHYGIDISGADVYGKPIVASAAGKVIISGNGGTYGNYVVIEHGTYKGKSYTTVYAHASKLLVSAGQYVRAGQTIALIGSTGWSTGPHLHFEIRENGVKNNPLNYLKT